MVMPWPPTVNGYWRHPTKGKLAGKSLISEEGRNYRSQVGLLALRVRGAVYGHIRVEFEAYPPDRRARDLDNLFKSALDSLQDSRLIENDSLIDDLRIIRRGIIRGGELHVKISQMLDSMAC